jgi:hypothetical protein
MNGAISRRWSSQACEAWRLVVLLGIAHMVVDATSIVAATRRAAQAGQADGIWIIHTYNLLAFATQPLAGWAVDRVRSPRGAMVLGAAMAAASAALSLLSPVRTLWSALGFDPLLEIWLAGLGNSLFHIGAGSICLRLAGGRAAMLGVLVGPGDLGVVIGALVGRGLWPGEWIVVVVCIGSSLLASVASVDEPSRPAPTARPMGWTAAAIAVLLGYAIASRSVMGAALLEGRFWMRGLWIGIMASAGLAKIVGGCLADRVGWGWFAVPVAIVAAPAAALASTCSPLAIGAMFLVQAAMPVTLAAMGRILSARPGLAFGLATLAVWLGSVPAVWGSLLHVKSMLVFAQLACAVSIFTALACLRRGGRVRPA